MTDFEFDNLPDEINAPALPEDLFDAATTALNEALASGVVLAKEAKAGFVYDRRGYMSFDSFSANRNPSYSSNTDDVVLQITVRIPNPKTGQGKQVPSLAALEEQTTETVRQAKLAQLEEELAQAEAARTAAEETARQKQAELDALRNSK